MQRADSTLRQPFSGVHFSAGSSLTSCSNRLTDRAYGERLLGDVTDPADHQAVVQKEPGPAAVIERRQRGIWFALTTR